MLSNWYLALQAFTLVIVNLFLCFICAKQCCGVVLEIHSKGRCIDKPLAMRTGTRDRYPHPHGACVNNIHKKYIQPLYIIVYRRPARQNAMLVVNGP